MHEGVVVWFTPGTVHRAVNIDGLRIVVLMSNAGLPEAGDAVMTFPADVLDDLDRYQSVATLSLEGNLELADAAQRRRDAAVAGFMALRTAVESDGPLALEALYRAGARIVQQRAGAWSDIIEARPAEQARRSLAMAAAIAAGDPTHLLESRTAPAAASPGERAYGMCGRLRTYVVAD